MRTVAIASLIALSSTLCAGGPSTEQLAGLAKAASAIADGASITTRINGSTVVVTRQNGVAVCAIDGKPIALRVSGPAPAPKPAGVTLVADTVAVQVAQAQTRAATPPPSTLTKISVRIGSQLDFGFLDISAGVLRLSNGTTIPIIGPPIGNDFTIVADAMHNAAYAVAANFRVGPYLNP